MTVFILLWEEAIVKEIPLISRPVRDNIAHGNSPVFHVQGND
jgi:hypothetical protein